ncbi:glycosyltransferase family 4 protein [Nocardia sp. NPDC088792]|uniref:glycosyltransferase family 4 protein n=1 Tax=Nocardia sp. NPDC088792 TaxID=3364332 RepID=UPI00382A45F4
MTGAEWFATAPGGLNRYFTDLYTALARRGDADVSAAAFGRPVAGGRSWGPGNGSTVRRAVTAFADRTKPTAPMILDRHFCLYGPPAPRASAASRLVVHFHGPWAAESRAAGAGGPEMRVKYALERLRYRGADAYVVLSEHFRDLLVSDYRVDPARVRVIAPGVDLDRFAPTPRDVTRAERMVLCVRRLEHRMGIDTLLRSWSTVRSQCPEARLVIVGTGAAEAMLRGLAESGGAAESIEFAGRATDAELAALYARSDVTVVPSATLEGFGLIALESLAAGRAPIVTDCGGLPAAVASLDRSLVVPVGNAAALAARIVSALRGSVPTADRCRRHAESFSWEAAAARHVALYRELCG